MTAAEWAAGCLMFGGIALVFYIAALIADYFTTEADDD
jgi:hypothetical protein